MSSHTSPVSAIHTRPAGKTVRYGPNSTEEMRKHVGVLSEAFEVEYRNFVTLLHNNAIDTPDGFAKAIQHNKATIEALFSTTTPWAPGCDDTTTTGLVSAMLSTAMVETDNTDWKKTLVLLFGACLRPHYMSKKNAYKSERLRRLYLAINPLATPVDFVNKFIGATDRSALVLAALKATAVGCKLRPSEAIKYIAQLVYVYASTLHDVGTERLKRDDVDDMSFEDVFATDQAIDLAAWRVLALSRAQRNRINEAFAESAVPRLVVKYACSIATTDAKLREQLVGALTRVQFRANGVEWGFGGSDMETKDPLCSLNGGDKFGGDFHDQCKTASCSSPRATHRSVTRTRDSELPLPIRVLGKRTTRTDDDDRGTDDYDSDDVIASGSV